MTKPIYILNGPNLNLLGDREPAIYGTTTLAEVEARCRRLAGELGVAVDFRQTNHEGVLVESVHEARKAASAIIINPAGYTFTSIALLDALKMFDAPKVELHISNVHSREDIYHHSLISRTATGVIMGFGVRGYELALRAVTEMIPQG